MNADYDLQIAENEGKLDGYVSRMEVLRERFIRDATEFAKEWYKDTVESSIKRNSDVTLKLDRAELQTMKRELSELMKNAGSITAKTLAEKQYWWHLQDVKPVEFYESTQTENLENAIRLILGNVRDLLHKYGYDKERGHLGMFGNSPYRYKYHLELSEKMKTTIKDYNEILKSALVTCAELNRLKRYKREDQAKDAWDSA